MPVTAEPGDPDVSAMRRLAGGEDLALNEIMERWTPRVGAFLARFLAGAADAADLTHETFVAVYRARERYRPNARFATWIFWIAANLARHRLRWKARHPEVSLDGPEDSCRVGESFPAAGGDPHQALVVSERALAVKAAIMDLPPDLREAVLLFEYEELSHAEIAKIAGCSPKAVETRLYRARQILKGSLAAFLSP